MVTAAGTARQGCVDTGVRPHGLVRRRWRSMAIEARNLAPLPGSRLQAGASLPMPGLTAWQGLFEHRPSAGGAERPRARRGRLSRVDGDAART